VIVSVGAPGPEALTGGGKACTGRSAVHRVTHAGIDDHEGCGGTRGIAGQQML